MKDSLIGLWTREYPERDLYYEIKIYVILEDLVAYTMTSGGFGEPYSPTLPEIKWTLFDEMTRFLIENDFVKET